MRYTRKQVQDKFQQTFNKYPLKAGFWWRLEMNSASGRTVYRVIIVDPNFAEYHPFGSLGMYANEAWYFMSGMQYGNVNLHDYLAQYDLKEVLS